MKTREQEWSEMEGETNPVSATPPRPVPHVFAAMTAVQAELSREGVAKLGKNQQQGFAFRAWDDVQQALSPILARHKVLVVPNVTSREQTEHTSSKGTVQFKVVLSGTVMFVSGLDGSTFGYRTFGEGMDTGDKATSKALTMMMKYALLHGLQIPLEGVDDADKHTPDVSQPKEQIHPHSGVWESMNEEEQAFLEGVAREVSGLIASGDVAGALSYIHGQKLDADERVALNTRFSSKERSAMKRVHDEQKKAA